MSDLQRLEAKLDKKVRIDRGSASILITMVTALLCDGAKRQSLLTSLASDLKALNTLYDEYTSL